MKWNHFCACAAILLLDIPLAAEAAGPVYHVTDLGALPSNSNISSASAIGNSGAVTGQAPMNSILPPHAFYWTSAGGMVDVGDFPGGVDQSMGSDVNSLGHVVGFGHVAEADATDSGLRALLWSSTGGLQNLGKPAGSDGTAANAINSLDQIVGYSFNSTTSHEQAFLWTAEGGFSDLGDLPGGSSCRSFWYIVLRR